MCHYLKIMLETLLMEANTVVHKDKELYAKVLRVCQDRVDCFKLCRKVTKKINRYFGGIAVLYKKELKEGIKFLTHKNDDYVWLKLSKSYFRLDSNYYVCLAYIPPENSRYYKDRNQDTLEYIESDIVKYSNMGHVMLIGDLNARTGIENDYVLHDANNMLLNNVSYDIDAECTG